jgi:hypothetical protein
MAIDNYVNVALHLPYKTLQRVDKLAAEYGLSRANTLMKLIESASLDHGEKIEVSSVTHNGKRHKNGIPVVVANTLREVL